MGIRRRRQIAVDGTGGGCIRRCSWDFSPADGSSCLGFAISDAVGPEREPIGLGGTLAIVFATTCPADFVSSISPALPPWVALMGTLSSIPAFAAWIISAITPVVLDTPFVVVASSVVAASVVTFASVGVAEVVVPAVVSSFLAL